MSQQTKELRRVIAHLEKIVKVLEELERKAPDPRQGILFRGVTLLDIFEEGEARDQVMGVYL
jgi:hypothetical protein